jgi:hypothetical protein
LQRTIAVAVIGAWLIVPFMPIPMWAGMLAGLLLIGLSAVLWRRRGSLIPEGELQINDDGSCRLTSAVAPAILSGHIVQAYLHLLGASLRLVDDAGQRHDLLILRDAVDPQALHALRCRIAQASLPVSAKDIR